MRLAVLTVACVAAMAVAPVYAQDSAAALRQDIQTLRQTLEQMEKRLEAIESGKPPPTSPVATAIPTPGTTAVPLPSPAPLPPLSPVVVTIPMAIPMPRRYSAWKMLRSPGTSPLTMEL